MSGVRLRRATETSEALAGPSRRLGGPARLVMAVVSMVVIAAVSAVVLDTTTAPPAVGPSSVAQPTPADTGAQPTRANTGPRYGLSDISPADFYASRTCNRQRINGDVRLEQAWMKGQTFTLSDCEITGMLWIYLQEGGQPLALNDMPTIKINHSHIENGLQAVNTAKITADSSYFGGSQVTTDDAWSEWITAPAPITITNSMFYETQAPYPTAQCNSEACKPHTTAFHSGDYGSGYLFNNVAFVQQGPMNDTATAAFEFAGSDSTCDGCWFLWDGPTPTYFSVYAEGSNVVIKNSHFQRGLADYAYPYADPSQTGKIHATYINNVDHDTGAPLTIS